MKYVLLFVMILVAAACMGTKPVQESPPEDTRTGIASQTDSRPEKPPKRKPKAQPVAAEEGPLVCPVKTDDERKQIIQMLDCLIEKRKP